MDVNIKKRWLKALRSGKYDQITGCLKNDNRYCCLGVLCDVIDPKGWGAYDRFTYKGDASSLELPEPLLKKVKLTLDTNDKLADMNDVKKLSFKEIASYISKNL